MQNRFRFALILFILFISFPLYAEESSPQSIRQLSNEVYRLSQEMIFHGSEGHAHEIVSHGQEMIQRTEALIKEVESNPAPEIKKRRGKLLTALKATLKETKEAVRLGEQEKTGPAVEAARKASFRAKQIRQQIQTLP
ncbi:MAG: hypothetical protein HY282_09620 [Nitrospirae bacterium]|nr:hypothetical protein [Candidatus Manganitrophaceae bacterium]